ncbi:MAG: hypothetical protein WC809_07335 [Sinimarinibacterium sp.]|jgi:hypothetical protein
MSNSQQHPGDVYSHRRANLAALKLRYPAQFVGPMISCSWPNGWHLLVAEACAHAAHHRARWDQIKEKLGGLTLHVMPIDDGEDVQLAAWLTKIESRSLQTCSLCGAEGARLHDIGGWLLTACRSCVPLIAAHRSLPRVVR